MIREVLHLSENNPVCNDLLNKKRRTGVKTKAHYFKKIGEISSAPGEKLKLIDHNSFKFLILFKYQYIKLIGCKRISELLILKLIVFFLFHTQKRNKI